MSEKIKKLREKMWEEYKDNYPPKGQAQFYYKDNGEYWDNGFDAAWALHEKLVRPLLEALEYYKREYDLTYANDALVAKSALTGYKEECGK